MQLRIFLLKGQEAKSACCQAKYPVKHFQRLNRNLKQSQKHAKLYTSIRGVPFGGVFRSCLDCQTRFSSTTFMQQEPKPTLECEKYINEISSWATGKFQEHLSANCKTPCE